MERSNLVFSSVQQNPVKPGAKVNGITSGTLPKLNKAPKLLKPPSLKAEISQGDINFTDYSNFNKDLINTVENLINNVNEPINMKDIFKNEEGQVVSLESSSRHTTNERLNFFLTKLRTIQTLGKDENSYIAKDLLDPEDPKNQATIDTLRKKFLGENQFSIQTNKYFFNKFHSDNKDTSNTEFINNLINGLNDSFEAHASSEYFLDLMKEESFEATVKKSAARNLYLHKNLVEKLEPAYKILQEFTLINDDEKPQIANQIFDAVMNSNDERTANISSPSAPKGFGAQKNSKANPKNKKKKDSIVKKNEYLVKINKVKSDINNFVLEAQRNPTIKTNAHNSLLLNNLLATLKKDRRFTSKSIRCFKKSKQ